ncbi:MAG TPA: GMC oxidoreductase [Methylomirabilota bacterium]|nr:GMC oxidoreductase [Methylomirabilota bacterium]
MQPRPRSPQLGRRQVLALGGAALAAAALPGCVVPLANRQSDLARAAEANYRASLVGRRRSVARPDGTEATESGPGVLASGPEGLRAARNARPGRPDFDVLIVGSGYGGAVCAARLAAARRSGVRIGLLERGREWVPGTFPAHLTSFNPLARRPSWMGERLSRNPLGLYGFYDQGDVEVIVGSGLGGTSLINCAVAIEAEAAVFKQPAWPPELRDKRDLRRYYRRARRMLAARATPEDRFPLKLQVHLATAAALRARGEWTAPAYPVELAVTFAARANGQGMRQQGCVQCGDCVTGCNVGAKNSLDMNYLPLAWAEGTEMFTRVEVERIETVDGLHRVHYLQRPDGGRVEERGSVTARLLILAAGALGSTEILLRSRRRNGLAVSDWLGRGFSANGNYLGFADYQWADPAVFTNSGGLGIAQGAPETPVGTAIQGAIDFREPGRPMHRRVVFEDLAHPSAHAPGVALLMLADLNRAITLLGCGHDTASGEIRLEGNGIVVRWPDYDRQPSHTEMVARMRQYADAQGGRFKPFTPARNYTAHPLGGCRMATTAKDGVVDHRGRVFDPSPGAGGQAVHPGLYVVDGSIVPTALGNNPLLTITALAERVAELIVRDPTHAALFSTADVPGLPPTRQGP